METHYNIINCRQFEAHQKEYYYKKFNQQKRNIEKINKKKNTNLFKYKCQIISIFTL